MRLTLQILISMSLIVGGSAIAQNSSASSGIAVTPAPVPVQRPGATNTRYDTLMGLLGGHDNPVFIVPTGQTPIRELLAAHEDMTVMTRILHGALEGVDMGGHSSNPFVGAFPGRATQRPTSIYLGGYGALFTLTVDAPLAPGADDEETTTPEPEVGGDPLWQQTRADLFEPERRERSGDPFEQRAPRYSAEAVEMLKRALIGALKYAANIRSLGPDDVVVVTVLGATVPGQVRSIKSLPGTDTYEFVDNQGPGRMTAERLADVTISAPTVLMIRATGAAIESFAKGQTNLQEFTGQVSVVTYPHLGQMMDSGPVLPRSLGRSRR